MKQRDFNQLFIRTIRDEGYSMQELASFLKDSPKLSAFRALEVYQEDYQARLSEALKNTYPAILFFIGEDDFHLLALAYIHSHPSPFSNLDDYGHLLDTFLANYTPLMNYPFLSEMAHFEWSLRNLFHTKSDIGLNSFELSQLLLDPTRETQLIQSSKLLKYQYKISELYELIKHETQVGQLENYLAPQNLVLFKTTSMIKHKPLTTNQFCILELFVAPCSLEQALKMAPQTITPSEIQELFELIGNECLLKI